MKRDTPPPPSDLLARRNEKPDLKELTISLGRSDIYINLGRSVELDNGHTLFEAILTDEQGSRVIYVDRDDIAETLRESFLVDAPEPEDDSDAH